MRAHGVDDPQESAVGEMMKSGRSSRTALSSVAELTRRMTMSSDGKTEESAFRMGFTVVAANPGSVISTTASLSA